VNKVAQGGSLGAIVRRPPLEGGPLDADVLEDDVSGYAIAEHGKSDKPHFNTVHARSGPQQTLLHPTADRTTCAQPTTTLAAPPRARRTRGRPTTTPLGPKRQRHEQHRRVHAAPTADRRPHDLPPDDNDTCSSAACAPQPPRTEDHATCPPMTTTRAAAPRARRTRRGPRTTPLAPR